VPAAFPISGPLESHGALPHRAAGMSDESTVDP